MLSFKSTRHLESFTLRSNDKWDKVSTLLMVEEENLQKKKNETA